MAATQEALRQSLVALDARPAPAGEMDVLLGPGWPGILLHEAVGHGLEGDFNRKKTSAFAGLMGQRVAAPGVTIVDDGTLVELDIEIAGIGPARKRALLHAFGSAKAVARAALSDLEKAPGLNKTTAKLVYDHFQRGD